MTTLTINELAVGDIAAVQAIDRDAHAHVWSKQVFVDQIERPDRVHLVGRRADGVIVGHCGAWRDGDRGRIVNVALGRDHRGRGYAALLLASLIRAMLLWSNIDSLSLEVRADNTAAQRLYRQFGFAPVGLERNFYGHDLTAASRDALVMRIDTLHTNDVLRRLDEIERNQAATSGHGSAGAAA
jgi:ribosomal-protein-alanine N-acetyltransferase